MKDASERYSEKRFTGKHRRTGMPVQDQDGREVETPSELDHARLGALVKHLASKRGVGCLMEENERSLLNEMAAKETWCGSMGGEYYSEIKDNESGSIKALLDDSTSGGLEIAPVSVDTSVVTFPLLNGELAPFVDLQPVARGRRIEGASIANVTLSSGAADATEAGLFTTTGLVSAIDTTIFACDIAIEVGRDFLSDSIVDVGRVLQALIGEKLQAYLDEQICIGDGSTEPEGIFTKSGISTITCDNTTTGPPSLADYYDLLFGVGKQYRNPAMQPCFISNDTTYARSRGIKIDTASPSTDQRPVFGIDATNSYMTLDWAHRIQNNIPNGSAAFGCLKKYRLYRRLGLEIKVETGGKELTRNNLALIMARARYGGKVVDASAFCKWIAGQS